MSSLHDAALAYARMGWPVFPCNPLAKTPACPNGFKDATTNEEQINEWWNTDPNYNPAVALGETEYCVVDLDGESGIQEWLSLVEASGELARETFTVKTPRGGQHLYFLGVLPPSQHRVAAHIDTRGQGSYVLLPPSVTQDGQYVYQNRVAAAALPAWVERCAAPRDNVVARHEGPINREGAEVRGIARCDDLVRRRDVAVSGQGGNARTYTLFAELKELGVDAETALTLVSERWNPHCSPPWSAEELCGLRDNAYRYAQNAEGAYAIGLASETFKGVTTTSKPSRFKLETEEEQDNAPPPEWLLPEVLPRQGTALLVGATQSYKSFVALDIALSVGSGSRCFGTRPARSGAVVYAAAEGRLDLKTKRRRAWKEHRGIAAVPSFYVCRAPMLNNGQEVQEFGESLNELAQRGPIALVVFDTIAKIIVGLDESHSDTPNRYHVELADPIAEAYDCCVLSLHHTGKDLNAGARGSAAWRGNTDTYLELRASHGARAGELRVLKHKDAAEPEEPFTFRMIEVAGSLVPIPTELSTHKLALAKEHVTHASKVIVALRALGALSHEHAVTTAILSDVLTEHRIDETEEERQETVRATGRSLSLAARDRLEPYCRHVGREKMWSIPEAGSLDRLGNASEAPSR